MIDEYSALPRNIEGVEVGVFLKVKGENEIKASLRSNSYVDVSQIASLFGGGGHIRAAGLTINDTLKNAKASIIGAIQKVID